MSHSLYGYLSRRTTEELKEILESYLDAEQTELHMEIVLLILMVLEERGESC